PVWFGEHKPPHASSIPSSKAVRVRSGLLPQIAKSTVVVVPNRHIEPDDVPRLRAAKNRFRLKMGAAEPTRVDGVDRVQRNPKFDHESMRAETCLRLPYDVGIVAGIDQGVTTSRRGELESLIVHHRIRAKWIEIPANDSEPPVSRLAITVDHHLDIVI